MTKDNNGGRLPNQMCPDCVKNLYTTYLFRQRCENAFHKLQTLLLESTIDDASETKTSSQNLENFCTKKDTLNQNDDYLFNLGPNEKCIQTDDTVISSYDFNAHRDVYKDEQIKGYTRFLHLQDHPYSTHPQILGSMHKCLVCNSQFSRSDLLLRHMRSSHRNVQQKVLNLYENEEYMDEDDIPIGNDPDGSNDDDSNESDVDRLKVESSEYFPNAIDSFIDEKTVKIYFSFC